MTTAKYRTYIRLLAMVAAIILLTVAIRSNAAAALYGTYPVGTVAGNTVVFLWFDDTHAPSYTLQVAFDANFTDISHLNSNVGSLISVSGFNDDGRTYFWRVSRNDTGLTSPTLSFVNGPSAAPSMPYIYAPTEGTYLGGKNGFFFMTSDRAYGYMITAATNSGFNNPIVNGPLVDSFVISTDKLPSDGSTIYWKAQTWNAKGWSDPTPTMSFINDCYMSSVGSGGGLTHIDSCTDDYTSRNVSYYLLKDISRRVDNPHLHNGEMAGTSSIITGLNSDNLRIEAEKLKGTPIVPQADLNNKWDETTDYKQDAIHVQVYTGRFYDYLLSTFKKRAADNKNINSFDGSGRSMYNLIKGATCVSKPDTVAYWNTETWNVHYCKDGASSYPELTGHEWGHAVSGTASGRGSFGLDYYSESGALEEAFADWMGLAFKQAFFNSSWQAAPWRFATSATAVENFTDTNQTPNYYNDNGYDFRADVGINSRIPNTMFYLLANGGEHPFSKIKVGKLNGGVLQGIGIETAMQIAFRANMEYWENNVVFTKAATQMSDAVTDNFSHNTNYPNLLHQVKNAWAAVGVGNLPQLTVTSVDSNKGTVSNPVKVATTGALKQYEPVWGGTVTVVATPKPGFVFDSWLENDSVVTIPDGSGVKPAPQQYTFPVTSDRTLTAKFVSVGTNSFGTINVGQSSPEQTITITNTYKPIIKFGQVQLNGTGAADFTKISDTCSNQEKYYSESCTIQLAFTPHFVGLREATLDISATDAANGQTVFTTSYQLSGNGVSTGVSLTPSSTTGGTVALSGSQLWGGTATATATPNAGYAFTGWYEDSAIVSSASSYSFTVTSTRSLLAMFSSAPAVITATPMSGNFSATPTGATSPVRTFTITNNGQQSLIFSSISVSGVNPTEFGVTDNNCGADLSPNSSCSIRMNFTPAASGVRMAMINIVTNDPATPAYVIPLSGFGGASVMRYEGGFSVMYYSTAQSAYNEVADGNELRLWAADFNESLNLNRPVSTTIRGGYNGNFADRIGKSALQGALTISSGTVIVDGLQIGGTSYQSTLSVAVNSSGSGIITGTPAGISCTGSCTTTLVYGDMITLTATPIGDAVFTGWSGGGCSGIGNCTVVMTGDMTVTASFNSAKISVAPASESLGTAYAGTATSPQTITVTSSGTQNLIIGTLSLTGTDATEFIVSADTCSGRTLAPSATCTLQAAFAPASTGAKTASILIPSNDPQTPVFSVSLNGIGALPTIFVSKAGNGAGAVNSSPSGISCGSSCTAAYAINTAVTLTATPDFGYTFSGWSGACSGSSSCALTMSDNNSVTATFIETPIAACSANPANLNGNLYPSIQAAYNAAPDGSTIKLLATDIFENFIADRAISVTIDGGYKCSFATSSGTTIIHGNPFIANGAVNMMNISVNQ